MKNTNKPNPAPAGADVIDGEFDDMPGGGAMVLSQGTQIRTNYTTAQAIQRPRDITRVLTKVETECELAGEDAYYSWTQGGKVVEGLSIDGAMILLRNFGNCVAEAQVVKEGPNFWVFDAVFVDLESGMTTSRQYRQRKGETHQRVGKDKDVDRLLDIAFQIGQSKAIRNVVLHAMPIWLKSRAMTKAQNAADGKYADLPAWIEKAIASYSTFRPRPVTKADLEKKIGRPTDLWTSSDIQVLLSIQRALRARETTVEGEFFPDEKPAEGEQPKPVPAAKPQPAAAEGDQPKTPAAAKPAAPATAPAPAAPDVPKAAESKPRDPNAPLNLFGGSPTKEREPGDEG